MKTRLVRLLVIVALGLCFDIAAYGQDATSPPPSDTRSRAELTKILNEAEIVLESQRKPDKAAALFYQVYGAASASHKMKGEALVGLVQCERLRGNRDLADSLFRELVDGYRNLPSIASRISKLAARMDVAAYISGIVVIQDGTGLDCDTGGIMYSFDRAKGIAPELMVRGGQIVEVATFDHDLQTSLSMPWLSDAPWRSCQTDHGLSAWIQVLHETDNVVIRFVTQVSGGGEPLPALHDLFGVGKGDNIEIHFEPGAPYSNYRIERRELPLGVLEAAGTVPKPPFIDSDVANDVRYLYRVTGIAADGSEGLPATTCATTNTCGVFSGTARITRGGYDFFAGHPVDQGGDITLRSTYGGRSGAAFTDYLGVKIYSLDLDLETRFPLWSSTSSPVIPPGTPFIVPLRGGGVAHCAWSLEGRRRIAIDYLVNPDAPHFQTRPSLSVVKKNNDALVSVTAPAGYTVDEIEVVDPGAPNPRKLNVKNGVARDRKVPKDRTLTYRAVAVDRHGRKSPPGTTVLGHRFEGIHRSEFSFHYQQGYSLERGELVPASEADVFFASCAGGISSVELRAPGGITNLRCVFRKHPELEGYSASALGTAIVAFEKEKIEFRSKADGDDRDPYEDVFLLKTRHGGWAVLAITDRAKKGGWSSRPVTVSYAYNHGEPVFISSPGAKLLKVEGITFDRRSLELAHDEYLEDLEKLRAAQGKLLDALDESARDFGAAMKPKAGAREVQVAGLFARTHAATLDVESDYVVSTFSFEHATRDDVEATRGDWDLAFGSRGNVIDVRTVADDRSTIWDLGGSDFDRFEIPDPQTLDCVEKTDAVQGHLYVIHVCDSDTDLWAKMEVLELEPEKWMIFRWEVFDDPRDVRKLERTAERTLKAPVVRIEIRAGAGGGNANRVFMDGTYNARIDEQSLIPLDLSYAPVMKEPTVCYVEGGFIPDGKIWVVETITFEARADGDSNGPGEFSLRVGPFPIAHIEHRRSEDVRVLFTLDRGVRYLEPTERLVNKTLDMQIALRPGEESSVCAEVANSSLCGITLSGRFEDQARSRVPRWADFSALDRMPSWFFMIHTQGESDRATMLAAYARGRPELRPLLLTIHAISTDEEYSELIEKMIEATDN